MKIRFAQTFALSLLGLAATVSLQGCGELDPIDWVFAPIAYPTTDTEKRAVIATDKVTVNGKDYAIGYSSILRSGDKAGSGTFGLVYDVKGEPIETADHSPFISNYNDHSSLLDVHGKLFMVSQFEDPVGVNYVTELKQDAATGKLSAVNTKPIDTSAIGGSWTHCAGSRTPWKTHLGSEEYEPDAAQTGSANNIKDYFGGDLSKINPYNYGFITEISLSGPDMGNGTFAGNAQLVKHYSMGRLAFELGYVMPDQKTVYMSDDGSYVGFFRYQADNAGDLSSGTLYAAKLTQKFASNGGSFDLSWIDLGKADDAEVKSYIFDKKYTFDDIFDKGDAAHCAASHALVVTATGAECLKIKPGMEKVASRLETRRYAAMRGATTELNKEEGITFDPASKRLFVSMSFIEKGMMDKDKLETEKAVNYNHIRVIKNSCGGVYALDLDDNYVAKSMAGLIMGKEVPGDTKNTCDINAIANPDNLTFIPRTNTLIIGEDTGSGHQNDLIWAYNLDKKKLTRIQSTPYGSETTSPYYYPNINGWGYMMSVVQHPYGESDQDKVPNGADERRAYTGYIGPFPAVK